MGSLVIFFVYGSDPTLLTALQCLLYDKVPDLILEFLTKLENLYRGKHISLFLLESQWQIEKCLIIMSNRTVECHAGMANDDPTIIIITEFSVAIASFLFIVLVIAVVLSCCVRRDRNSSAGNKYQSVNQEYR